MDTFFEKIKEMIEIRVKNGIEKKDLDDFSQKLKKYVQEYLEGQKNEI